MCALFSFINVARVRARNGLHGSRRINHYRLSRTLLLVKHGHRDVVYECQKEGNYDRGKKNTRSFSSIINFYYQCF